MYTKSTSLFLLSALAATTVVVASPPRVINAPTLGFTCPTTDTSSTPAALDKAQSQNQEGLCVYPGGAGQCQYSGGTNGSGALQQGGAACPKAMTENSASEPIPSATGSNTNANQSTPAPRPTPSSNSSSTNNNNGNNNAAAGLRPVGILGVASLLVGVCTFGMGL